MLGITVADAVTIGTLILACLAAWRGSGAGEAARKRHPPDPAVALLGGTMVDTVEFQKLNAVLGRIADAIEAANEARERRSTEDRIDGLVMRIDRMERERAAKP